MIFVNIYFTYDINIFVWFKQTNNICVITIIIIINRFVERHKVATTEALIWAFKP